MTTFSSVLGAPPTPGKMVRRVWKYDAPTSAVPTLSLQAHPVPVREEAIRAIGARSLAIDVYIWLASRLHSLEKSIPVSWAAIHGQFGAGFQLVRQIKPSFTDALTLALAVHPEARVDVEQDGVVLHPPSSARSAPSRSSAPSARSWVERRREGRVEPEQRHSRHPTLEGRLGAACVALGDANRVRGPMHRHWQAKAMRSINAARAHLPAVRP
jgi:hypothetical protein